MQISLTFCSSVDLVYSKLSFKQYARKQFLRKRNPRDDQYLVKKFDEEISNLKRLHQQHLITLIGSYTDHRSVAFLMEPIADYNLETYLRLHRSVIRDRLPSLRIYFGCLINAVSYLHRQKVRHRDLKPQNILIKNHIVYITDFGNAFDWSKRGRDTTNDSNIPFSEFYAAPEMAKRSSSSRGTAADVWSLGVAFLDMVTVLRGSTTRELLSFLENHGTRHPCVWGNASATNEWFKYIRQIHSGPDSDNEPLNWIKDMTQSNPANRPHSWAVANQIRNTGIGSQFIGFCCAAEDEWDDYQSPPSSHGSDDDAEIHLTDLPAELDLGEKPYGAFVGVPQQSRIERWLEQDDFISDFVSEAPDDIEEDIPSLPYEVVIDGPTVTTATEERAMPLYSWEATNIYVTLDALDGYDIVQEDSDEEEQTEFENIGYEVVEDSSESEASTIRQVLSSTPPSAVDMDSAHASPEQVEISVAENIRIIEDHSNALPEELDDHETVEQATLEEASEGAQVAVAPANDLTPDTEPKAIVSDESDNTIVTETLMSTESVPEARVYDNTPSNGIELGANQIEGTPTRQRAGSRVHFAETSTTFIFDSPKTPPAEPEIGVVPDPTPESAGESPSRASRNRSDISTTSFLSAANLAKHASQSTRHPSQGRSQGSIRNQEGLVADEPEISPSLYMQQVWKAASSASTSVMSERTKKAFAGFGSGLAWQDKSLYFWEKYVEAGKAPAVRELLKAGCNPGTRTKPMIRPLMLAVKGRSQRHNKCVQALLAAGANVNAREISGRTALHYAIEHEDFHGYTNLIRDLLEAGADPNNKDKSGDFPLLQILYDGYEHLRKHRRDALACLLQPVFATEVNVMHPGTRSTPLHLAIRRNDRWAVSMLLERGARVNEPNGTGSTPLMLAANSWRSKLLSGQLEVLKFLLQADANINEQDASGKTALHLAASQLCEGAVHVLLNKNADPLIKDRDDCLAYVYAKNSPPKIKKAPEAHSIILESLFKAMGHGLCHLRDNECAVVTAVRKGHVEDVEFLLDHGAELDYLYECCNKTPLLHLPLIWQQYPVARLLLARGASRDVKDEAGRDASAYPDALEKALSESS